MNKDEPANTCKVILAFGPSSDLAVLGWEYPRADIEPKGDLRISANHLDTDSAGNKSIMRFVSGAA